MVQFRHRGLTLERRPRWKGKENLSPSTIQCPSRLFVTIDDDRRASECQTSLGSMLVVVGRPIHPFLWFLPSFSSLATNRQRPKPYQTFVLWFVKKQLICSNNLSVCGPRHNVRTKDSPTPRPSRLSRLRGNVSNRSRSGTREGDL